MPCTPHHYQSSYLYTNIFTTVTKEFHKSFKLRFISCLLSMFFPSKGSAVVLILEQDKKSVKGGNEFLVL